MPIDSTTTVADDIKAVTGTVEDLTAGGQRAMNAVTNTVGNTGGILGFVWDAVTGFVGGLVSSPLRLVQSAFNGIFSNGLILGALGAVLTYVQPDAIAWLVKPLGITPEDLIKFRATHGELAMVAAGAAGGAALGGAVSVLSDVVGGIFGGGGLAGPAASSGDAVGKSLANIGIIVGAVALGAVLTGKDQDLLKSLGISGGDDVGDTTPQAPVPVQSATLVKTTPAPVAKL